MENFTLKEIDAKQASQAMSAAGVEQGVSLEFMNTNCNCFELDNGRGAGAAILEKKENTLWVHGLAAGQSVGLASVGLSVAEGLALNAGCNRVAFKTARPGLVRIAKKQGYRIAAFIIEKTI